MRRRHILVRLIVGTFLMGMAYKCIFDSAGMVTGGFSGIAIILKELWGIPLGITTLVLNVPVFVAGYKIRGRKFVEMTALATVLLSVFLEIMPVVPLGLDSLLLTAVYGGVLGGAGVGMVITAFATTGGTDMIATLIHYYKPYYSISHIMQVLDFVIVAAGAFVFGINQCLHAGIAIYIMGKVSDRVIDGMKTAKAVYIISDRYEQIAQKIATQLQRGGTYLNGSGIYSKDKKTVILCVVSRKQVVNLKKIIWENDESAFVMVSDVREALGEGFVENSQ